MLQQSPPASRAARPATREALLRAASAGAPPCVWFYVTLLLGRRLRDGAAIPKCVAETAVARILLWYVRDGRGGMVSLKASAVRRAVLSYGREHRCRFADHEYAAATLSKHMRILMAFVRGWVRAAPRAVTRHLAVDRQWLVEFLTAHRPCASP